MNKKRIKIVILLIHSILACFFLWMAVLGGLWADGFLNLTAIENETQTMPLINFLVACLCPPVAFGTILFDLIIEGKKRSYNGNKNKN